MALYKSKTSGYKLKCTDPTLDKLWFDFSPFGTYETEIGAEIAYLDNCPQRNIRYYRIGEAEESVDSDQTWKDRLHEDDDIEKWNARTVQWMKNGEEVHRCPHGCGYAERDKTMLKAHANFCSENPEVGAKEGAPT